MTYQEFIASKIPRAESSGFEPMSEPHSNYWSLAVGYCETAESELKVPTLFDMDAMVQRKESTK